MSNNTKPTNAFIDYIKKVYTNNKTKDPIVGAEWEVRLFTIAKVLGVPSSHRSQTRVMVEMMLESLEDVSEPINHVMLLMCSSALCLHHFYDRTGVPVLKPSGDDDVGIELPIDEDGTTQVFVLATVRRTLEWILKWLDGTEITEKPVVLTAAEWNGYIVQLGKTINHTPKREMAAILQILGYQESGITSFAVHSALLCVKMHLLHLEQTQSADIAKHSIAELGAFYDKEAKMWSECHEDAQWPEYLNLPKHHDGRSLAFSPENLNNFYYAAMNLLVPWSLKG